MPVPDSNSLSASPNPSRLMLARKRRGYTKTKLAKLIGVAVRAVSAFEAVEYPPARDTFARIRSVLHFPEEFFYGDDLEEPEASNVSFRGMARMSAAKRDMALSQGALAFHFNDWLETRFELPKPDLPDLSREPHPEAASESLRRAWRIGELAIRNMIHLMEAKGVRIFSLAIDAKEVDAFSLWRGGVPYVFLNTYKSFEHSRFDAAHELGHLVLHKHGGPQGREAEKEANAFASSFLMPRGSVFAHAPRFTTYPILVKLKKTWGTSVSALAYRLRALGLISEWQYRGIFVEIAKQGQACEPEEAPRETSLILPRLLASLYDDGISRSRIAEALSIPTSELEQLLFGLAISSIDGGRRTPPKERSRSNLRMVKK